MINKNKLQDIVGITLVILGLLISGDQWAKLDIQGAIGYIVSFIGIFIYSLSPSKETI